MARSGNFSKLGIPVSILSLVCAQMIAIQAKSQAQTARQVGAFQADEILAVITPGTEASQIKDTVKQLHGTILEQFGSGKLQFIRMQIEHKYFSDTYRKVLRDKKFRSVQLNRLAYKQEARFVPDDPDFPKQWQFKQMHVEGAWLQGDTGRGQVLGIIDDGVSSRQKDLLGRVDRGISMVTKGGRGDMPTHSHGTSCATISCGATNNRVLGAAPAFEATIIPVDVTGKNPSGYDSDVIKGIEYLADRGVRVINLSLNGEPPDTYSNKADHEAVWEELRSFYDKGGLVFNSAGNEDLNDSNPREKQLIVVTASNSSGQHASWSVTGSSLWFAAPGDQIGLSNLNNQFVIGDGTSFSTPLAASVALMVKSANPRLTNDQILEIMTETATKPPSYTVNTMGFGIPNAHKAVEMARRMR